MSKKYFSLFIIFLLLLSNGKFFAQEKRGITAEDLWKFKRIGSLRLSHDQKTLAFTLTEYNIDENKGYSDVHFLDLASKEIKKITTDKSSEGNIEFSPDGKYLAFTAKREGDEKNQLYLLPLTGGEAFRLTEMPMGVTSIKWFSDSKHIAFASNLLPEFEIDFEGLKKELKKRKDSKMSAKVTENRFYRYWDSWLTDGFVTHLFSVDVASKEIKNLTPKMNKILSASGSGASYDISPNGEWIALSANVTPAPYKSELNYDLFLLNTNNGELKNITENNLGGDGAPKFSHDGKFLYYQYTSNPKLLAENSKLKRISLNDFSSFDITSAYDISVADYQLDGKGEVVYFTADNGGEHSIYSINTNGKNLKLIHEKGVASNLTLAAGSLYFLHENFSSPADIFSLNFKSNKTEQFTNMNKSLLDSISFGKVEEYYFKGADEEDVQMFLIYPPNFDANKKWGLLHLIHGGPHGAFQNSFHYRWNGQAFAAMGYVCAVVNFHGSTGFGEKFANSIIGAHGDKPFTDIMNASDFILRKFSFIDENKIAGAGGSYGGYLVNWIAGHTNKFAALISHAGVYNLMGQFASDMTHFREVAYGGAPWYDKENVKKWSPAEFADNFQTPMLIVHGEKDYRVVVTQGLELYGVLQGKGIPSRLLYFPDENHWVMQPQNSIYWYKEFEDWLDRFLK